ncbi:esterase B1 isoform X1 [Drosophila sulfurigaster albostrigata]|uniref:esterase B1 isoform X1 n=2 Tax=Drosophila sulfurigaster albostrigata TaxID=89887 RepID=UPI002D21A4AE|nr:esterase B1 isoform X1 [Drosophila sulfurigaster albostrigata]
MSSPKPETTVKTKSGTITGSQCTSIYGDDYISFECIPYAQPPLGALRFKAPVPVHPWKKTLMCRQKGEKPLQFNQYTKQLEGIENCLYLNVYVKSMKTEKPLPLIVFFFGGGFEKGDSSRDLHSPDYFMMRDVVVATVSYRVGPLGFLSLENPAAGVPGNAGLKDQLLAMKWITQNATSFNADPANVTAFGESAGAASVHYLMLNPNAAGLFHKAIMQSGNALCSWSLCPIPNLGRRLAENLGMKHVQQASDTKVLEFLQSVPGDKLVTPYLLSQAENLDDCVFQFGPVVEPYSSEDCVLLKPPIELVETAWGNSIPVLMSGTSFEGLLMYARVQMAPYLLTSLKGQPQHMLPLELKRSLPQALALTLGKRLKLLHFGDRPMDLQKDSVVAYCEYASYKVFWHPIMRTIKARLRASAAPTYLYRFDFDSSTFNHQRRKYCGDQLRGVAHIDDHSYIWYGDFSWKLDKHTAEFQTIERMIDILTTFAATSNPNCGSVQSSLPKNSHWPPLSKKFIVCLNISEEMKIIDLPEINKLKVWDSVYKAQA